MSKLLRMENIGKSFGVVRALDGVNLELDGGEVLALMGENGAGKSTLMNILSGALVHYEGRIFIDDQQVQIGSPLAARALGIAKIHQELQMAKELSIAENMFMGREKANRLGMVDKRAQEEEARKYLKMLELDLNPHRQLKTLRVGEQQMVEIAKALSLHARILILDEPTSAISKQETEQLFRVIRRLQSEGVGLIYITHRMEEVFEIADKLEVLRDGRYIDTVDARQAIAAGTDGVKFHLLYVLRGTDLEADYHARKFRCLTLEEYAHWLRLCLAEVPPEVVVHRITGDGAKRDLVAPLWSADKKKVLNYLRRYLF